MPSSSNPRPLLSSNNKGHQAPARHNQPLGMSLVRWRSRDRPGAIRPARRDLL